MECIMELVERHDRFTYDLRGECRVLSGCVAAYRREGDIRFATELSAAIEHALQHDGILGAWRDPSTGEVEYCNCRIFTDQDQALRFARDEEQRSIFNLNRMVEVPVVLTENVMERREHSAVHAGSPMCVVA
jgi:hypothetical protein